MTFISITVSVSDHCEKFQAMKLDYVAAIMSVIPPFAGVEELVSPLAISCTSSDLNWYRKFDHSNFPSIQKTTIILVSMSISDGSSKLIPILQNYPCLSIEDDDKMDQRRRKAIFLTAMIHACATYQYNYWNNYWKTDSKKLKKANFTCLLYIIV